MKNLSSVVQKYIYEILGFVGIFVILCFIVFSPRGKELTTRVYDPLRTTAQRNEIVVVAIDDRSLQSVGAWPWDREVFARLTSSLVDSGVKLIAFDVLFFEPRGAGDDIFKKVLTTSNVPIILGAKQTSDGYYSSFFIDNSTPKVTSALVNVTPDVDGKVRVYPEPITISGVCRETFAESIFRIVTFKQMRECTPTADSYFRYQDKVLTYSAIDVLSGDVSKDLLLGKIVLIGSTSLDLNDFFVSLYGAKIPGVHVHASILSSLLNNEGDKDVSPLVSAVLLFLFGVSAALAIVSTRKTSLQIGGIVLLLGTALIITLLFFSNKLIIPFPWLVIMVFVASSYTILFKIRHEKRQGDYVRSLFSRYVNKDILHQLLATGKPVSLLGEKREITVLFSDLRGFTTFSESLLPEDLMKLLNAYFNAMTVPILKEDGTIDKFIGDAIMAFWNAPLFIPEHETKAVRAALRMDQALTVFNEKNGTNLHMGIGLHTGACVVGNVGGEERISYTALGDVINLGSRLESLTKKYGVTIIISEEVKNKLIPGEFTFRKLDVVRVKGKNKSTTLYQVITNSDITKGDIDAYEKAFQLYQDGKFKDAEVIFKGLLGKEDEPSKLMLSRIKDLSEKKDWDGIWSFDDK